MLTIRMQRTGRKGHAMFRVVVQDSRRTPSSGKIVAQLGHYDPHAKSASVQKDKATFYLEHGAQPSPRVARLLQAEGVTLPKWVKVGVEQKRTTRNPGKLRKNTPAEAVATAEEAGSATEQPTEEAPAEPAPEAPESEVETPSETPEDPAEPQQ